MGLTRHVHPIPCAAMGFIRQDMGLSRRALGCPRQGLGAPRLAMGYDRRMALPTRLAGALLALAGVSLFACAGAAPPAEAPLPLLGSDATCADRAQARPVCLHAVETRCASQRSTCEGGCQSRLMPGSDEKHPPVSGDMQEGQCRESCRQTAEACAQSLLGRCPTLCAPGEAPPAPPSSASP
jgi:hypothetical protein